MPSQICYLGDDHLGGAAAYLAGVMTHCGLPYDYVPSTEPFPGSLRLCSAGARRTGPAAWHAPN